MSELEDTLLLHIRAAGLPMPEREYRGVKGRRFRFDLAWPDRMLAVELEGGVFNNGWHQSVQRYLSDCEKYTLAAAAGWRVLRFAADSVRDGRALAMIERALQEEASDV